MGPTAITPSTEHERDLHRRWPGHQKREIEEVRNIDVAPTILKLLGVQSSDKIQGMVIPVLH
jgi:arylsulfatase A-like enzyme